MRRLLNNLRLLGLALDRTSHTPRDLGSMNGEHVYVGIIYLIGVTTAEKKRLTDAYKAMADRIKLPPNTEISVAVPRNSSALYTEIHTVSAEAAGQLLLDFLRQAEVEAGVTLHHLKIEIQLKSDAEGEES